MIRRCDIDKSKHDCACVVTRAVLFTRINLVESQNRNVQSSDRLAYECNDLYARYHIFFG